jgi:hypothetical protein
MDNATLSTEETKMSEAEVTIRLAGYLLSLPNAANQATVEIDSMVVQSTHHGRLFEIEDFLASSRWQPDQQRKPGVWRGWYEREGKHLYISERRQGKGDVVVQVDNRLVVAECKGGPLSKKPGGPEYRILKGALGQAVIWDGSADDLVLVAVPDTQWFRSIAERWRQRPLVRKAGIQIALVNQTGGVSGFSIP